MCLGEDMTRAELPKGEKVETLSLLYTTDSSSSNRKAPECVDGVPGGSVAGGLEMELDRTGVVQVRSHVFCGELA